MTKDPALEKKAAPFVASLIEIRAAREGATGSGALIDFIAKREPNPLWLRALADGLRRAGSSIEKADSEHKLADVYVATELARSNAYFGAWALSKNAPELPVAAAAARVSANEAFYLAAKENIQVHGGMGFTWEHPAHLYFKRARSSAVLFGEPAYHREKLSGTVGL